MADTVYKWRLYCETEEALVEGWAESAPDYCFHDNQHTIDEESVTQIDEITDTDVVIAGVDIGGVSHINSEAHGFQDLTGYNLFRKGYRFVVSAGTIHEHDISYTNEMKLQGLGFRVDGNATDMDHLKVEMVDVDGVVYPPGTVLGQFADTIYCWPNREFNCTCADAKTLPSWVYLRVTYESDGESDVVVLVEHILRTVPA